MNIVSNELTRPIVGIENRTAQEVFDIMCDRFRLSALSPRVVSDEPPLTCPHIDKAIASGELSDDVVAELHTIRDINSQLRHSTWALRAQLESALSSAGEKEGEPPTDAEAKARLAEIVAKNPEDFGPGTNPLEDPPHPTSADKLEVVGWQHRLLRDGEVCVDWRDGEYRGPWLGFEIERRPTADHAAASRLIAEKDRELYLVRNERDNLLDNLHEATTRTEAAEAAIASVRAENERMRCDAGELVVAQYATSAAQARIADLEALIEAQHGDVVIRTAKLLYDKDDKIALLRKTIEVFGSSAVRDRIAEAVGCNHDLLHEALQAEVRAARSDSKGGENG